MPVVRVRDLTVASPAGRLVGPVSLEVDAGERVGLVGTSGAGKSLTAAALVGTLAPTLHLGGSVSYDPATHERAVGAVVQESALALNPLVRVGPQLALPLPRGLSRAARWERVVEMLDRLDLAPDTVGAWPLDLSGGQRQRVALGLAMMCPPALLVADEPTSALDPPTQDAVLHVLTGLVESHRSALLLISHDLALVGSVCSRILVMHEGSVCEEAPTHELLVRPQHPVTRDLVRAARTLGITS